jgi:predicted TIM-barrel fold metal-dependent hydrolase
VSSAALTPTLAGAIDVHSHFLTSRYRDEAIAAGHARPDGMPALPEWSIEAPLAMMDEMGIRASLLSVSSPGVHFGDDAKARALARHVNEEAAKVVAEHPARFGLFASLPLPDVEGALDEVAYAFDTLKADGVVLQTNHNGAYLGDERLTPLLDELDRREACIFIHPTSPICSCCQGPGLRYPRPMMEFMFETTRTVFDLILSGALDRHPHLKIIVPHAGATIPVLADRVASMIPMLGVDGSLGAPQFFGHLKRFYYDLAGQPTPRLLPALLTIADEDRLLYGSDWPFTPRPLVTRLAEALRDTPLISATARRKLARENPLALFKRFANADGLA